MSEFEVIRHAPQVAQPSGSTVLPVPRRQSNPEIPKLHWHGEADLERQRWLVKYVVPETGAGLISGQWGTGKTFLALDLAGAVMTGTHFAGARVKRRGGVLFVAAEAAGDIPIRLAALVESKLRDDGQGDLLRGKRPHLPFGWIDTCTPLLERNSKAELVAVAKAAAMRMKKDHNVDLVLIFVDTVAAAAGFENENDAAQAQKAMSVLHDLARETGAAVIGLDHFGKDGQRGTRGSSAKEASADFVLALLGERDEDGAVHDTHMAVRKLRAGATGRPTPFSLRVVDMGFDEDRDHVTSCIVEWGEPGSYVGKPKQKRGSGGLAASQLQEAIESLGGLPKRRDALRNAFYAMRSADEKSNTKRQAFNRAVGDLDLVAAGDDLAWPETQI